MTLQEQVYMMKTLGASYPEIANQLNTSPKMAYQFYNRQEMKLRGISTQHLAHVRELMKMEQKNTISWQRYKEAMMLSKDGVIRISSRHFDNE